MADLAQVTEALKALEYKRATTRFLRYSPYPKQLEFHALTTRFRLLIAANQVGKTLSAGNETAYHATGYYPDWWKGYRFEKPTIGWVAGVSLEGLRDGAQNVLLGPIGQEGTGTIPKERILQIARKQNGALDFMRVRFGPINGRAETFISFKSYDQGREKFQAATVNWVWFDEEPPSDIYAEGITRTNATRGLVYVTFTPLKGVTEVVRRFLYEKNADRGVVQMTIDDAPHIRDEDKASIISNYLPHEVEARTRGVPVLGSGLIFPIEQNLIEVAPFNIPSHWPHLGGLDFGYDHPFAAVELAYDKQNDTVYFIKAFRISRRTPMDHVAVLKHWGDLLFAWPHDGLQHDKGSGETLADQYRKEGLKLTPKRAQFLDGSYGVEAGLFEMLMRMQSGRLKIFSNLREIFDEIQIYHRNEGKVNKINDDLLSAMRYAVMMLRYAKVQDRIPWRDNRGHALTVAPGTGEVQF
jgi:phage terminase large subunit-like protein